mmetsp:Transcript_20640/g.23360  ORF Transcript_20640/g.23360 Transcript_20640/m.23360 type:complete len:188 (+) Transcript_20640:82-645(+)|eukprot:CAMPEP_0114975474 /NCGR_PEP_ID=MMETSP0216-20121206/2119_1 /TAXON_ID=223996 /ORGANISM="Protocruzia adherens, Strain Boccale" /LENGTH=187 /DNA_ID=CAMNT_0002336259 /DNA_START=39 /DNA_END=602 /DNA_ORIENTATION=-
MADPNQGSNDGVIPQAELDDYQNVINSKLENLEKEFGAHEKISKHKTKKDIREEYENGYPILRTLKLPYCWNLMQRNLKMSYMLFPIYGTISYLYVQKPCPKTKKVLMSGVLANIIVWGFNVAMMLNVFDFIRDPYCNVKSIHYDDENRARNIRQRSAAILSQHRALKATLERDGNNENKFSDSELD